MIYKFYILWKDPMGRRMWSGPHDDIDAAKRSVPDNAVAQMIVTPLAAMTPSEKRNALPIMDGEPV